MYDKVRVIAAARAESGEFFYTYGRVQAGIPKATGFRIVTLIVTYSRTHHWHDVDAFWLSVLDGLKRAELIVNDTYHFVRTNPVIYRSGSKLTTEVILQDAEFSEPCDPTRPENWHVVR